MPRLSVVQPSSDSSTKPSSTESALLGLPLESVLEPGTGKKMAAALGARFGVDTALASADDVSSFERIIALVERLVAAKKTGAPASTSNDERKHVDLKTLESDVRRVLLANMVAKTGYPLEMLTEDLDLEADLGIDTVKQVEIFSKTREHFNVPRDPNLSLRDFNTIKKVIEHIRDRVVAHGEQARSTKPAASSGSGVVAVAAAVDAPLPSRLTPKSGGTSVGANAGLSAAVQAALISHTVKKTGYPAEMLGLELDLEADLGIDTVKQVEIFAKTREQFGIARDAAFVLREYNTLQKYIEYVVARAPATSAPAAQAPAPTAQAPAPAASPQTVRSTLLSMSLAELGLSETEKQRLAKALAGRLGVSSPNVGGVTTLEELVTILGQGGKSS